MRKVSVSLIQSIPFPIFKLEARDPQDIVQWLLAMRMSEKIGFYLDEDYYCFETFVERQQFCLGFAKAEEMGEGRISWLPPNIVELPAFCTK